RAQAMLARQPPGDLAEREPGPRGQRIETDERREGGVGKVALENDPAEWIGTIEDDDVDPGARARAHDQSQRPLKSVVTRADVLQIDDERVEPGEHRRRRLARHAVEADD